MIDRDYMLNRLRSRAISKQEFNYEILSAPPIYSMFTPEDIQQLHYLASSAEYTAKLRQKYEAIDKIMTNRGFQKLVAGTNRVSYVPTFANNFIVKVAYDTVALKDSPREFKNQFLLKPFCTKVFEVTPCGTLGVFEKVNPVTSIKEYISMAADIFRLLNDYVIGDYIIDDIGTEYYQNIGYRNGFGPVILDFPYVYEVDPKKIWCNKPDHNDPTGYCNGAIDYDLGFNKLKCRKCGAIYKPFELAKKIEYTPNQLILESEERRMKIRVSGGSLGNGKFEELVTGDFQNPVKAIRSNKLNKKIEKAIEEEKKEKTVNGVATPKKEEKAEEPEVEEETPKKVVKAFSINEEDVGKGDLGYESNDDKLEDALSTICDIYYSTKSEDIRKKIIDKISTYFVEMFNDQIDTTIKMIAKIFKKKPLSDAVIKEFLDSNSCSVNNQFLKLLLTSDNYYVSSELKNITTDENMMNIIFNLDTSVYKAKTDKIVVTPDTIEATIACKEVLDAIGITTYEDETIVAQEEEFDFYDSENADGLDLVRAEFVSKKDLFPSDEKKGKIIAIKNDNGKYLTINGKIVAIDNIDDRNVRDITVVPKDWYNDTMEILDNIKKAPTGAIPEEEISDEEASGEEE